MIKKAFTLTELLVATVLLVIAVAGMMGSAAFFALQVKAQMERADCRAQLNFAFEDMKLHLMSAASVKADSMLAAAGEEKDLFSVTGEKDVYTITPDVTTDNVVYTYLISDSDATKGALIRRTGTTDPVDEILVEARYSPVVKFIYQAGDPPNFLTIEITATTKTSPLGLTNTIDCKEGMRFWFVSVAL